MDLELHQLDRRYEALRTTSRERDSRVLASLARDGQQLPVVVIAGADSDRYVLVDGYKRVRGLHQLGQDLVRATCWDLPEDEALLLGRLMRSAEGESVLEQAWLVRELSERFGLSLEDLARRFGRSPSWVSRRLGLVATLPDAIQELVRAGKLAPHAAMKHLLPLARANRKGAISLAKAIAPLCPSTRQTALLCAAFARGNDESRAQLLAHPDLLLRATAPEDPRKPDDPAQQLARDVGAVGGIARKALARVEGGVVQHLLPPERARLRRSAVDAHRDVEELVSAIAKETSSAG
ncbi:MAG: ParB N-terminal domain-containing protein [Polyangiaceae bacterium]|nr:ParB N-terminal domain-containing protein [Polyangiaceae bacterium]